MAVSDLAEYVRHELEDELRSRAVRRGLPQSIAVAGCLREGVDAAATFQIQLGVSASSLLDCWTEQLADQASHASMHKKSISSYLKCKCCTAAGVPDARICAAAHLCNGLMRFCSQHQFLGITLL